MPRRPQLLTVADVARKLNLDGSQVRRLARELEVGFKVGRAWLFSESDVDRLERGRKPVGRPQGS